ncbi:MAG: sodium:proton antiporter [Candidatus Microsaccharimonas sp.]
MLSITAILALFILLIIASVTFFAAKRLKLPYTVLLVIVGLILVPLVNVPGLSTGLGFLKDIALTPELLFYVFLPILIFESAFNMNVRKLVENAWHISLLSVLGLLLSTIIIAIGLFALFALIGLPIPFILALLFGAIISSTDPVAVLALFKEYNAPKRLTLIFEGESLFNDGTAVALFLVILAIATDGFHGAETVIHGIGMFVMMVSLGIVFGIIMATLFSKIVRFTRKNDFVAITLLLTSAHLVFIFCELINQHPIFGIQFHVSSIIATTVASLFLGTYARHILSPRSDEYLQKSIEHLAFVANSLVFLLAGLLFASTNVDLRALWVPILITVAVVVIARIISVYAITLPLNRLRPVSAIPRSWQIMLAWGSLRGALAIIIVLLIPEDFTFSGWVYEFTPKELLLALTIGCILATLLFKATTIGGLIKRLGLNKPSALQQATILDTGIYYLSTEKARTAQLAAREYVDSVQAKVLYDSLESKLSQSRLDRKELVSQHGEKLLFRSLHHMAITIETRYLKDLYSNEEVNEAVYRKIIGKLTLQQEKIEYAQHEAINPSSYRDRKDIFEGLVHFSQNAFSRKKETPLEEQYQYYRAQSIIARKVTKVLTQMQTQYDIDVFIPKVYEDTLQIYENYRTTSQEKMTALAKKYPEELQGYIAELSHKSLHATGNKAFRFFLQKGIADESMLETLERTYGIND